jgi:hypothetical protein
MTQDDIKGLAVKLSVLVDSFETRGDEVVQQTLQASQAIHHSARQAAQTAQQITSRALEEFQQTASHALKGGLREPVQQADRSLQASMHKIQQATNQLEQGVRAINRMHTATAWKAFIVSSLASLAVIGVAAYVGFKAHQDIARSEWIGEINAAVAQGNLAHCPGSDGICARVGGKWVRLDIAAP